MSRENSQIIARFVLGFVSGGSTNGLYFKDESYIL